MEVMKQLNEFEKDKITSLELVDIINQFREKEYNERKQKGTLTKAQIKKGKYTELKHYDFLKTIRDEFDEELQQGKISLLQKTVKTNNGGTKQIPYFELTLEQAKQLLMKESKLVRKWVLEYIRHLEKKVQELQAQNKELLRVTGKIVRNLTTDNIKVLLEKRRVPKGVQRVWYGRFTNQIYEMLGLPKGSNKLREITDTTTIELIKQMETVQTLTFLNCVDKPLSVDEVYKRCKKELEKILRLNEPNPKNLLKLK